MGFTNSFVAATTLCKKEKNRRGSHRPEMLLSVGGALNPLLEEARLSCNDGASLSNVADTFLDFVYNC